MATRNELQALRDNLACALNMGGVKDAAAWAVDELDRLLAAPDAMDELRRACAETLGVDPETWPEHGNAPLAIAAAVALGGRPRVQVRKLGRLGAAFDAPDTYYAYTYTEQPDNLGAWQLGRAAAAAGLKRPGDNIDRGLQLLKELQDVGFGVYQLDVPVPES